jgi:hypothetical protein
MFSHNHQFLDTMFTTTLAVVQSLPGTKACGLITSPDHSWAIWSVHQYARPPPFDNVPRLPIIFFEIIAFSLAAYKAVKHAIYYKGFASGLGTRLMDILIRDSVVYFLLYVSRWSVYLIFTHMYHSGSW